MKKPFLQICLLILLLLSPAVYSQSIGVAIGSGYYYFNDNYTHLFRPLTTVSLRFGANLDNNFRLYITPGYGKSNYSIHQSQSGPSWNAYNEYHANTDGFLTEIECQYQHYLTSDSLFEPTLGIGIGYCDYKTKLKTDTYSKTDDEITTKGFSQFISLGMNIHISKKFTSYIELKKLIFHNIRINLLNTKVQPYTNTYEEDYSAMTGLSDLGITLGVNYNF
jgi:hypothetical protein